MMPVVDYDPAWPLQFQEIGRRLRAAVGETALRIDHIGSTAVPGLAAKPVIDIQISIARLEPVDVYAIPLQQLGYVYRPANPDRTKRFFYSPPEMQRCHIHVRRAGSWSEQFALLFRDYMRNHEGDARLYAGSDGRKAYDSAPSNSLTEPRLSAIVRTITRVHRAGECATRAPGGHVPLSRRDRQALGDQPALPLEVEDAAPPRPRERRHRAPSHREAPVQFALEMVPAEEPDTIGERGAAGPPSPAPVPPSLVAEPLAEPLAFDPDPFAEIPGFTPTPSRTQDFVLLPGSLRGRLDLREFTRFLAGLPTVVRDWEGAPEVEDGGVRLSGSGGGAWIYPEANRVRLTTDGELSEPVGGDLLALCRWLESRAGMRLYPAGEITGAGVDRSLDPWEVFLGRQAAGR